MESYTNPPVLNRGALEAVWYSDLQAQIRLFAAPVGPGFLLVHYSTQLHVNGVCQ